MLFSHYFYFPYIIMIYSSYIIDILFYKKNSNYKAELPPVK